MAEPAPHFQLPLRARVAKVQGTARQMVGTRGSADDRRHDHRHVLTAKQQAVCNCHLHASLADSVPGPVAAAYCRCCAMA